MNVPQEVLEHKTLMVALLASAAAAARELEVKVDMSVAELARALDANRTAAYQQRQRLVETLQELVAVRPGRPAAAPADGSSADVQELALTVRMLEFRTKHLDAVSEYERRTSYSAAFRRFILGELDVWQGTHVQFAVACRLPGDTLKDWVSGAETGLERNTGPERPAVVIPVDASETTRAILEAFKAWQGSTRAFLRVAQGRLGYNPNQIVRVLRTCRAIKPRARRAYGYRHSMHPLSPGAVLVTDGKMLDVELTASRRRIDRNWQGIGAVREVVRAFIAVTNGVPREQLAGGSRLAALRAARPSAAQQAADRAFIQALKERHERLQRSHWREKIKPAARRLLDQVFSLLALEDRGPSGKLRDFLATYEAAAIRQAAAIGRRQLRQSPPVRDPATALPETHPSTQSSRDNPRCLQFQVLPRVSAISQVDVFDKHTYWLARSRKGDKTCWRRGLHLCDLCHSWLWCYSCGLLWESPLMMIWAQTGYTRQQYGRATE